MSTFNIGDEVALSDGTTGIVGCYSPDGSIVRVDRADGSFDFINIHSQIISAPPPVVTQQQSISVRYVRKLADLEVGDTGTLREHGKNGLSYREAKFTKHDTSNGYFLFDNPNWIDTIIVPAHQAQNWEMVVESTVGEPEYKVTSFGKPQPCLNHFWKEYQGLHEIWKNCIHCGVKYEDHIGGNAQPQEEEIDDEFIIF